MSAEQVLAQQKYIHRMTPGRCSCGEHMESPTDASHARHLAELQLDALKAAGYALVELPSQCIVPTGWGDDCLGAWPANGCDDPVSAWPKRQVATPDDKWIDPSDARSLAAALLAAADAAEALS